VFDPRGEEDVGVDEVPESDGRFVQFRREVEG